MTKPTLLKLGLCVSGALGTCLFGLAAPAPAADQTEPRCAGLLNGAYANPNNGRSYYSCQGPARIYELPCADGKQDQPLFYAGGSGPGPQTSRCDRGTAVPGGRKPTLTAGQARTGTMHPYIVHGLYAKALREDGTPLFGAKVVFAAADGTHLCTAFTDKDGKAVCDSEPVSVPDETLRLGYSATFAGSGDGVWNPAHAQGGITVL